MRDSLHVSSTKGQYSIPSVLYSLSDQMEIANDKQELYLTL